MPTANDHQVGGSHYRAAFQHWDLVADVGMNYFCASVTKYITRWRGKNGVQDLGKAKHYAEKYVEVLQAGTRLPGYVVPSGSMAGKQFWDILQRYKVANSLGPEEYAIVHALVLPHTVAHVATVVTTIRDMMEREQQDLETIAARRLQHANDAENWRQVSKAIEDTEPCHVCRGSGTHPVKTFRQCSHCYGRGYVKKPAT